MTTYFTAPDGHGEETLWVRDPDLRDPLPVIRQRDLRGMAHHWDELVARVIAGNLSATEQWALDKATQVGGPLGSTIVGRYDHIAREVNK